MADFFGQLNVSSADVPESLWMWARQLIGDLNRFRASVNIQNTAVTVATLPAPNKTGLARMFVKDATVAASGNFGAAPVGGGANTVPVFCNGTAWLIG